MNILPVIAISAAILVLGRKKRKKTGGQKRLPASVLGEVFPGDDPPDIIKANIGERFSVNFSDVPGTGYTWKLAASPADDSLKFISQESVSVAVEPGVVGGTTAQLYWIFEGQKAGSGSIVFHHYGPGPIGERPPEQIIEIQTQIA